MGLRIGGKISGGTPLVDAQLVGYVNTSLFFQASAVASGGSTSAGSFAYRYGVYLYYNLGYGAYATIKFFPNWALAFRNAYNPSPRFTIYENTGSFSGNSAGSKRSIEAPSNLQFPRRSLFEENDGAKLTSIDHVRRASDVYDKDNYASSPSNFSADTDFLLGKRADLSDDSLLDGQSPDFTQQLTCPAGDTASTRLPDFRRRSPFAYFVLDFLFTKLNSQLQYFRP